MDTLFHVYSAPRHTVPHVFTPIESMPPQRLDSITAFIDSGVTEIDGKPPEWHGKLYAISADTLWLMVPA